MENLFFEWKAVLSYRSGRTFHGGRFYNLFSGDKIDQTNSKHHFQLIFRSKILIFMRYHPIEFFSVTADKTYDIDLSSKATGFLAKVSISNDYCYPKEQIKKFEKN